MKMYGLRLDTCTYTCNKSLSDLNHKNYFKNKIGIAIKLILIRFGLQQIGEKNKMS